MNSSDSAEELVKIYLDGVGFTLRIAGEGSKNLIVFLMAMAKEKGQTKGKTRLTNMLKTGKEQKIFTIKSEDLKKFSQEAKKYGILYCVLADKKNEKIDGMVDVMVRAEDASKVQRIAERFNFKKIDTATIIKEREKELELDSKSTDEKMIDDLLAELPMEEKEQTPSNEQSEEKNQLEHSLNTKKKLEESKENKGRKSVKKELQEITEELKEREKLEQKQESAVEETIEKTTPRHLKTNEDKKKEEIVKEQKGKHFKEAKHYEIQNRKKKKKKKERNK